MSVLSSGLETANYNAPQWQYIINANIMLLNSTLLKINGLLDVNTSGLRNGSVLMWNAAASKWVMRSP